MLKELYTLCDRNAGLSGKLEMLEKENEMLRGRVHQPQNSTTSIEMKQEIFNKSKTQ